MMKRKGIFETHAWADMRKHGGSLPTARTDASSAVLSLVQRPVVQREAPLTRHRHVVPADADRRVQQRPVGSDVAQRERGVAEGQLAALVLLRGRHAWGAALETIAAQQ